MGFDTTKFMGTKFRQREEQVDVPDLEMFFPKDEPAKWVVRGMTGNELAECNIAVERNKNIKAILEGVASNRPDKIKEAISQISGGDNVPDDIVKRVTMLTLGSVDPKIDESTAVQLCAVYPVEFYNLTTAILRLTGLGQEPGK